MSTSLPPDLAAALKTDLAEAVGLDSLSETERAATIVKIGDVIFQLVLLRVFSELDEAGQRELEAFIAAPENTADPKEFYDFLRVNIPDLDDIIAEEIAAFKRDAAGTIAA